MGNELKKLVDNEELTVAEMADKLNELVKNGCGDYHFSCTGVLNNYLYIDSGSKCVIIDTEELLDEEEN